MARGLRQGRSRTVGLILSDVSNPFFGKIVRGVEDELNRAGYGVVTVNTDNTLEKEALAVQRAIEMRLDGLIVSSASREGKHFARIRRENIPLVFVNREPDDAADDAVVSDNVGGAEKGVAHLIAQGHKRIGIVVGPQRYSSARQRQMGYHKALLDAGIPLIKELLVEAVDTTFASGLHCIQELLALGAPPTAVFVTNNPLTLGVVTGLRRARRRIPEDVAVLAFDNSEWASLFGLSGIHQSTHQLGRHAALLLLKRLDGYRGDPERMVLETELVPVPRDRGD
jgi:DNA-binding LacI/PurR family transcriptional regulator